MQQIELPTHAIQRVNPPLFSHGHFVEGVGVNVDSSAILSASQSGTICAWDAKNGSELQRLRERCGIRAFAVHRHFCASALQDGTLRVRSSADFCETAVVMANGLVNALAFSVDGSAIYCALGKSIVVFDIATAKTIGSFDGHGGEIKSIAMSVDGSWLGSCADDVRVWSVNTFECVFKSESKRFPYLSISVSANGNLVAAGGEGLQVWDFESRHCIFSRSERTDAVLFSHGGETLLTGGMNCFRILEQGSFRPVFELNSRIRKIAASTTHDYCVLGTTCNVLRLDLRSKRVVGRGFSIDASTFENARTLICLADGMLRRTEIGSIAERVIPANSGTDIIVSSQSLVGVCDRHESTVTVWDLVGQTRVVSYAGEWASFSPTERLIAIVCRNKTIICNVPQKNALYCLNGQKSMVFPVFSPAGNLLAVGSYDRLIRVWDFQSNDSAKIFAGHTRTTLALAFSPDGNLLASSAEDNTFRIWQIESGKTQSFELDTWATSIAFGQSSTILVIGDLNGYLEVWDISSAQRIRRVEAHDGRISKLAMTPDRQYLVSSSTDGSAIVWDALNLCKNKN